MARQKRNRKAARLARKQARAERIAPQRQKRQARAERRKAARQARAEQRRLRKIADLETAKAQRESRALERKSPTLFEREQKSATSFFGHAPTARELNTWRGLANSGALDRIRELTYINYEAEAVKDAAKDLLKTDMTSDEVISALEEYIKEYAQREQSLYDYVESKFGTIIPR